MPEVAKLLLSGSNLYAIPTSNQITMAISDGYNIDFIIIVYLCGDF
jgi:hypothetical protein